MVAEDDAAEEWLRSDVASAYFALKTEPSRAIPVEDVRKHFEAKWSLRSERDRVASADAHRAAGEKLDERLQSSEAELEAVIEDFEQARKTKRQ